MKKLLLTLCLCVAATVGAFAQKGEMAAGLSLGYAPCLESGASINNLGIGAKFQYNVSNPIRLEADIDYWLKNKGCDVFEISANANYLFNVGSKLKVYPIVGVGIAFFKASVDFDEEVSDFLGVDGVSSTSSDFLVNAGLGAEYALSQKLAVSLEAKYQYIKDFNRLPIKVGVTYKF